MIISIALGIVLAVVILRLLPYVVVYAGLACIVAYQVVRALLGLIVRGVVAQIRSARYSRSVQFGLFLSAVIIAFFELIR